jgi:hypothetical protein
MLLVKRIAEKLRPNGEWRMTEKGERLAGERRDCYVVPHQPFILLTEHAFFSLD